MFEEGVPLNIRIWPPKTRSLQPLKQRSRRWCAETSSLFFLTNVIQKAFDYSTLYLQPLSLLHNASSKTRIDSSQKITLASFESEAYTLHANSFCCRRHRLRFTDCLGCFFGQALSFLTALLGYIIVHWTVSYCGFLWMWGALRRRCTAARSFLLCILSDITNSKRFYYMHLLTILCAQFQLKTPCNR